MDIPLKVMKHKKPVSCVEAGFCFFGYRKAGKPPSGSPAGLEFKIYFSPFMKYNEFGKILDKKTGTKLEDI